MYLVSLFLEIWFSFDTVCSDILQCKILATEYYILNGKPLPEEDSFSTRWPNRNCDRCRAGFAEKLFHEYNKCVFNIFCNKKEGLFAANLTTTKGMPNWILINFIVTLI